MDVAEGDLIRQVLAVLAVFALLAAAVWKLRGGPLSLTRARSDGPRLSSAGRIALTPQHVVHLIRIDGREIVVATHPQGCVLLSEIPASGAAKEATA
jgi:flagellar biogenesis protein FliO